MAAQAPREGLEFVPGTMEEVGVELLKHVEDPLDVVAYAGYGFWAPKGAIAAVKGADKQELTNAPIAPRTAPYVDDAAYEGVETDLYGQPVEPDPTDVEVDLDANAPVKDIGVGEKATEAKYDEPKAPEKLSKPFGDVGVDEKPTDPADEKPAKRTPAKKSD